jgi:hypothetical protein
MPSDYWYASFPPLKVHIVVLGHQVPSRVFIGLDRRALPKYPSSGETLHSALHVRPAVGESGQVSL